MYSRKEHSQRYVIYSVQSREYPWVPGRQHGPCIMACVSTLSHILLHLGLRSYRIRELCCRCWGWWKACWVGSMGYSRTGGLRPSPTSQLPWFTRHLDLFCCWFTRFIGQRTGEGSSKSCSTLITGAESDSFVNSGFLRSCTSVLVFPSFSWVVRRILDVILVSLRSYERQISDLLLPKRYMHFGFGSFTTTDLLFHRAWLSHRRLALDTT